MVSSTWSGIFVAMYGNILMKTLIYDSI